MILSVLSDNRSSDNQRFTTEHGLSILLEIGNQSFLLDTGASNLLLRNAQILGKDISKIDYVFLSHGHVDHTGGLSSVLTISPNAQVLVSPYAVNRRFFSKRNTLHSITNQWPLETMKGRTTWVDNYRQLEEGIYLIAQIPNVHPTPLGNSNLYVEETDNQLVPDDFRHEIALYVHGLLFTGCAHNGLENILAACPWPVHTVIGGFHLLDSQSEKSYEQPAQLRQLAQRLALSYPSTTFYTSHCTGNIAFEILKEVLGDHIQHFSCGMQFEIP